jgi:hypothetical protein
MLFPAVRTDATDHYSHIADLFPCSSLQCYACEQMVQIVNDTASRPSYMQFPAVRCVQSDSKITNHRASRHSSMQFPVVRCVRADDTDH